MDINSYRDLVVWQKAMDLAVLVYEATSGFPANEIYGLTSQARRAATSIAANVAEGHGRASTASFIQFLRIAQGSLKELETHMLLAERLGFLGRERAADLLSRAEEIGKMIRSLIGRLGDRKNDGNE